MENNTINTESNRLNNWLNNPNKKFVGISIICLSVLFLIITAFLFFFCYWVAIPELWKWGLLNIKFVEVGQSIVAVLRAIAAISGIALLIIIPFIPTALASTQISKVVDAVFRNAEDDFKRKMQENEAKQAEYEKILREEYKDGLITLVNYSKLDLEQYYNIGLAQTRVSYRYSIIAMWIGFLIIVFGIISHYLPFNQQKDSNVQLLTITSGVVTEVISALFLFIYKSSKQQLRYFYNRQVYIHNALLAYKIAATMTNSEACKRLIIEKILDFGSTSSASVDEIDKIKVTKVKKPSQNGKPVKSGTAKDSVGA